MLGYVIFSMVNDSSLQVGMRLPNFCPALASGSGSILSLKAVLLPRSLCPPPTTSQHPICLQSHCLEQIYLSKALHDIRHQLMLTDICKPSS
jgi:hypothetical protein